MKSFIVLSFSLMCVACGSTVLQGEPGRDGNSIVGPQGEPGRDGNSIVGPQGAPGKNGNSIVGPQGQPGVNGTNGTNGRDANTIGLVWVDSTGSVMPFANVQDSNMSLAMTGDYRDPNGIWWAFSVTNNGTTFSAVDPNAEAPSGNVFYVSPNCTGPQYQTWTIAANVTATVPGATNGNVYVSTSQPQSVYYASTYINGTCQNYASGSKAFGILNGAVQLVTPPTQMGVAPYHQVWVDD